MLAGVVDPVICILSRWQSRSAGQITVLVLAVLRHDQHAADLDGGNQVSATTIRRWNDEVIALLAANGLRESAAELATRALPAAAAIGAALFALLCFTVAGLSVLERHLDPAAAWAIVGGCYALLGAALSFVASRRRR